VNDGAEPFWRDHWMAVRLLSGKVPCIFAAAGVVALMCRRIFSSTAVAL